MTDMTSQRPWFTFKPEMDTALAFISIPLMTAIYFLNTHYGYEQPAVFFFGFILIGHLLLNTALPAYVVLKMRGEGLAGLGITRRRLLPALILSILLGASFYPSLASSLKEFDGDPAPNMLYNAIAFWEPLFVFGWLQLRFERAFGIVAGVLMAGIGFSAYHIGSFPSETLLVFLFTGIFYGAIFASVRNLFVLIPITWAIASTMGTIEGGFIFDWGTVAIYVTVLFLQIIILFYISSKSKF